MQGLVHASLGHNVVVLLFFLKENKSNHRLRSPPPHVSSWVHSSCPQPVCLSVQSQKHEDFNLAFCCHTAARLFFEWQFVLGGLVLVYYFTCGVS